MSTNSEYMPVKKNGPSSGMLSIHKLADLFNAARPVIGAVHFLPMAGYSNYSEDEIYRYALHDLQALEAGGVNGDMFENNYDIPHKIIVATETVAMMTKLIGRLRKDTGLPIGVSVLWNDHKAALSIAKATEAQFIRVPVFVDHVMTNYGEMIGNPEEVISYRRQLVADDVLLFTDIHVKHSQILNADTIEQSAQKAIAAGSDALIVTGKWTGDAPDLIKLQRVRQAVGDFPIIVGSGANQDNAAALRRYVDGVIVSKSINKGDVDCSEVNLKHASLLIDAE